MALINQDIKNFVQGISQQPPTLRDAEQLEEQLNGFSSEASGLQKRPPTMFVSALHKYNKDNKPLIHFIERDNQEQYVVILDGDDIVVYDLQGRKYEVNYEDETQPYIQLQNPRRDLQCVTIADYTFILNKTVTTQMTSAVTENVWDRQGALINIKSGQYGRTYKIVLNGSTIASHETPDGSDKSHTKLIATDYIAQQLAAAARNSGWAVTTGSSWLYISSKAVGAAEYVSSVEVYDGYNNQAAFGIHRSVQKFTNLPASAPDGFTVKVAGEKGSSTDDYYVRYIASEGIWKECAKPNISCELDKTTMPHALVREADGSFKFKTVDWAKRDIGDDDSNAEPSFVGQKINSVFYHRNRLGLLSGENVILTRSADFFNFWMTSAMEVQDTDPIDLAVSDNKISTLYHAVSFDAELVVFSKDAQFVLKSTNVLSLKDAILTPAVTHFGCALGATPVNAGRNIYFVAERAEYTTVREFFTAADNTESKDAQDITSHVPSYIPNGVYSIIPSSTENILLFLTEGEEDSMYVYKYLFIDSVRQQAAWSKWNFQDTIYGAGWVNGYLYIVIERNGYLTLEKMSFTFNTEDFDSEPYRVLLDSKLEYVVPDRSYDENYDYTILFLSKVLGEVFDTHKNYALVTDEGLYIQLGHTDRIELQGDYTGRTLIFGFNYNFRAVLSTIYIKQSNDNGVQSMLDGRLQLRKIYINYASTNSFNVYVNTFDKEKYDYEFNDTSRVLGTNAAKLGEVTFSTGKFPVPIQCENTNCEIVIESDAPTPLSLIGASWVGNYVRRTRQF